MKAMREQIKAVVWYFMVRGTIGALSSLASTAAPASSWLASLVFVVVVVALHVIAGGLRHYRPGVLPADDVVVVDIEAAHTTTNGASWTQTLLLMASTFVVAMGSLAFALECARTRGTVSLCYIVYAVADLAYRLLYKRLMGARLDRFAQWWLTTPPTAAR